jgi:5-methylcytosine-specific restriction protein A
MHITSDQIVASFEAASRVYEGQITTTKAANELHDKFGLNVSSARDYIEQHRCMIRGEIFKRTLSAPAMEYFLSQIEQRRGRESVENALVAAWKHVEYYEGLQGFRLNKFRSALESFQSNMAGPISEGIHEASFAAAVADSMNDSSDARRKRLQNASRFPVQTTVTTRVYERNRDVVAEVLLRANGVCEQCKLPAPFMRKSNGKPYLEVHHKVLLSDNGEDSVENSIALCPNCHRQQHYG